MEWLVSRLQPPSMRWCPGFSRQVWAREVWSYRSRAWRLKAVHQRWCPGFSRQVWAREVWRCRSRAWRLKAEHQRLPRLQPPSMGLRLLAYRSQARRAGATSAGGVNHRSAPYINNHARRADTTTRACDSINGSVSPLRGLESLCHHPRGLTAPAEAISALRADCRQHHYAKCSLSISAANRSLNT